jgi:hypothetical protein
MKRKEFKNRLLRLLIQDRDGYSAIKALLKNKIRQPE